MRCCVEDEGLWPFGVALRGEASNHLMLRWLKTVVVSDEEKAHQMRQVGIRKASESEPLSKCRNQIRRHRNWGAWGCSRTSLAGARVLARRCPAWRRREPGLRLSRGTWEGGRRHCLPVLAGREVRGSALSGRNREALSTVAASAGGPARSSGEALVTGVDAKGPAHRLVCSHEQPG
jgi:hypothetical protein